MSDKIHYVYLVLRGPQRVWGVGWGLETGGYGDLVDPGRSDDRCGVLEPAELWHGGVEVADADADSLAGLQGAEAGLDF